MALLYDTGIFSVNDVDGAVGAGWKVNFYTSGTSSRRNTYPTLADAIAGTNANTNPVVIGADGRLPAIWLLDSAYKSVLTDENDVVKVTRDPIITAFDFGPTGIMEPVFPNTEDLSQFSVTSRTGNYAITAMSRSSDNPNAGSMSNTGVGAFCQNNNASQVQSGYAIYGEARRSTGAGTTHGTELNIVNFGSVVGIDPYNMSTTGLSNALWLSSGRSDEPAGTNSSLAIGIHNNNNRYTCGIVFGQDSLETSKSEMITGAVAHKIAWYSGAGARQSDIDGTAASLRTFSASSPYTIAMTRARPAGADTQNGDDLGLVQFYQYTTGSPEQRAYMHATRISAARSSMSMAAANDAGQFVEVGVNIGANNTFGPVSDNNIDCGGASSRWANIRAGNGTIQTSDARTKTPLKPLPKALIAALREIDIGQFQFLDSVAEKGKHARKHVGVIAQQVVEACAKHKIDAFAWGFVGQDPWEETVEELQDVEEPVTEEFTIDCERHEIVNGQVVVHPDTATETRAVVDTLPAVDDQGNPVIIPAKPAVVDAETGEVRAPAQPARPRMVDIPRARIVQKPVKVSRPKLDKHGKPMMLMNVRYSQLAMAMIAALRDAS